MLPMNKCFLGQKSHPSPHPSAARSSLVGEQWGQGLSQKLLPVCGICSPNSAVCLLVCLRGQKGLVLLDVPKQGESQRRPALLQRR